MNEYSYLTKTHYCPFLNRDVRMTVEYVYIPMVKTAARQYKKVDVHSCDCNLPENCNCKDRSGSCDVYKEFPNPLIK